MIDLHTPTGTHSYGHGRDYIPWKGCWQGTLLPKQNTIRGRPEQAARARSRTGVSRRPGTAAVVAATTCKTSSGRSPTVPANSSLPRQKNGNNKPEVARSETGHSKARSETGHSKGNRPQQSTVGDRPQQRKPATAKHGRRPATAKVPCVDWARQRSWRPQPAKQARAGLRPCPPIHHSNGVNITSDSPDGSSIQCAADEKRQCVASRTNPLRLGLSCR